MVIVYDHNSDTFQTRTRRWERDRELSRVIIPDWPTIPPVLTEDTAVTLRHYVEGAWHYPTRRLG